MPRARARPVQFPAPSLEASTAMPPLPGLFGEEEKYLFDLMGYLVIEDALSPAEVAALNAELDRTASEQGGMQ